MPALISILLGGLISITGSLVGRVLVALGLGVVTYSGLNASLTFLKNQAVQHFHSLPPEALGMIGMLKVGTCISIVFSAMLARAALNGLQGDTVKKWVLK